MKKLLSVLALGFVLASCNNGDGDKTNTKDTSQMENPAADAMKTMNDADDSLTKAQQGTKDSLDKIMNTPKDTIK